MRKAPGRNRGLHHGADDEARTRDLNLGKVALYQLSYVRTAPWRESNYTQPRGCAGRTAARRARRRTRPGPAPGRSRAGGGFRRGVNSVSARRFPQSVVRMVRVGRRAPGLRRCGPVRCGDPHMCGARDRRSGGCGRTKEPRSTGPGLLFRADDEARTRDLNLGKVALYQLSYVRTAPDRLPPIGASTSLPDPQEWSERPVPERVTGIAHCAFPLEGGCSTTELHPHGPRDPASRPRPSACPRH